MIYNDYELPFERILEDNKQKRIHRKKIESLAIEIYKFQAGLTPPIMSDLIVTRENNYNPTNSEIWDRNYVLQGTQNMEPDSGKVKGIGNIKKWNKNMEV